MRINRCGKPLLLGSVFLFIFLGSLVRFEGPTSGYWDTYITLPALFLINQPAHFLSKEGTELYRYQLPGSLPHNLVNKGAYGIISKDQRLGAAILFSPWAAFFNLFGFRLFFALTITLIAYFILRTTQLFSSRTGLGIFSVLAATCNSYFLSLNKLNPNILGMMLISLLLYLLLSKKTPWLITGMVYGVLCGVRETGVLFFPAILYQLLIISSNRKRDTVLFIFGALITLAPLLYWNKFAFGGIFTHPTQFHGLEGFRPVFAHKFLFWKFDFNGMLNYPFYEKIVRTPYFAFPVFFLLPLVFINSFGIIFSALVIFGLMRLFREQKAVFIFLLLWFIPTYLLFCAMENWSTLKTTFLLLFLNPLVIFMSKGAEWLLVHRRRSAEKILQLLALSLLIFLAVKCLFYIDFPADPRWYMRFPRVLRGGEISYIGYDLRTKKEDPQELRLQKRELTMANLLPRFDSLRIDAFGVIGRIKKEIVQRDVAAIDYWKYIYEP